MSYTKLENEFYYLNNKEIKEIIKEYKIGRNIVFNEETQKIGIEKVYNIMEKSLKTFYENDLTGIFILLESYRYLFYLIYFQKYKFIYWDNYYSKLLKLFHSFGYLRFKKDIYFYKDFKTKKPLLTLNINTNYLITNIIYNSSNDLVNDFGRYKTDKLLKLRNKEEPLIIDIKTLLEIIND